MGIIMWELVTVQAPSRGNLRALRVPEECPQDIAQVPCCPTAASIHARMRAYRLSGS